MEAAGKTGQVVMHFKTGRHGIVTQTEGVPNGKMQVYFPDTLATELRWHKAFYETDLLRDLDKAWALEDGHQGIWWEDAHGQPWFLMKDGPSTRRPSPHPVVQKKVRREALPAGHL